MLGQEDSLDLERHKVRLKAEADRDLEQFKATNALELAKANAIYSALLASTRITIDYALSAFRSALILNGAAAIALLSFVGAQKNLLAVSTALMSGLAAFALGAVFATVGLCFSYLAQSNFTKQFAENINVAPKNGMRLRLAAIVCAIASIASFCGGLAFAYCALSLSSRVI
jgi:hypothetical protein